MLLIRGTRETCFEGEKTCNSPLGRMDPKNTTAGFVDIKCSQKVKANKLKKAKWHKIEMPKVFAAKCRKCGVGIFF